MVNIVDQLWAWSNPAENPRTPSVSPTWPLLLASTVSSLKPLTTLRSLVHVHSQGHVFNLIPNLVPIFDGRGSGTKLAFSFLDADFDKLPSWLKWSGKGELPDDSLIVVGYTWTTYISSSQIMLFSSNLLFIILLALGTWLFAPRSSSQYNYLCCLLYIVRINLDPHPPCVCPFWVMSECLWVWASDSQAYMISTHNDLLLFMCAAAHLSLHVIPHLALVQ